MPGFRLGAWGDQGQRGSSPVDGERPFSLLTSLRPLPLCLVVTPGCVGVSGGQAHRRQDSLSPLKEQMFPGLWLHPPYEVHGFAKVAPPLPVEVQTPSLPGSAEA